jgi:hypothetical protein
MAARASWYVKKPKPDMEMGGERTLREQGLARAILPNSPHGQQD